MLFGPFGSGVDHAVVNRRLLIAAWVLQSRTRSKIKAYHSFNKHVCGLIRVGDVHGLICVSFRPILLFLCRCVAVHRSVHLLQVACRSVHLFVRLLLHLSCACAINNDEAESDAAAARPGPALGRATPVESPGKPHAALQERPRRPRDLHRGYPARAADGGETNQGDGHLHSWTDEIYCLNTENTLFFSCACGAAGFPRLPSCWGENIFGVQISSHRPCFAVPV